MSKISSISEENAAFCVSVMKVKTETRNVETVVAANEKLSFQREKLTSVSAVSFLNSSTIALEGALDSSMSHSEVIISG